MSFHGAIFKLDIIQAHRCNDEQTLETMRTCYLETGMLIDPHTAVGLHAATAAMEEDPATPMVIVSTAHPAKFPQAVEKATGIKPPVPARLAAVLKKAEHFTPLANDISKIQDFIRSKAGQ